MSDIKTEFIENGKASGEVSAELMSSYNGVSVDLSQYRRLDTLPERAWNYIDNTLIRVAKEELNGIADLNQRAGLSVNFDGMSASVYTRERLSEVGDAAIATDPDSASNAGKVVMDSLGVPLMVTYKDFEVDVKRMAQATRVGLPLQTATVEEATRSVARLLEQTLFEGQISAAGSHIYGYTKFPGTIPLTIRDWDAVDPDVILDDVIKLIELSIENNHYGPWILYIPWQLRTILYRDYTVGAAPVAANRTIEGRLLEIPGLEAIKSTPYLPYSTTALETKEIVLVEMSSSTVQLINGLPMRAVQWEAPGSPNWKKKFKVLTISVPLLMSDYKGQCGIIHGTYANPTP